MEYIKKCILSIKYCFKHYPISSSINHHVIELAHTFSCCVYGKPSYVIIILLFYWIVCAMIDRRTRVYRLQRWRTNKNVIEHRSYNRIWHSLRLMVTSRIVYNANVRQDMFALSPAGTKTHITYVRVWWTIRSRCNKRATTVWYHNYTERCALLFVFQRAVNFYRGTKDASGPNCGALVFAFLVVVYKLHSCVRATLYCLWVVEQNIYEYIFVYIYTLWFVFCERVVVCLIAAEVQ